MISLQNQQKILLQECNSLLGNEEFRPGLKGKSLAAALKPIASAIKTAINAHFAAISQVMAAPPFGNQFKVTDERKLIQALSPKALASWYGEEGDGGTKSSRMQVKSFAHLSVSLYLYFDKTGGGVEDAEKAFAELIRSVHGAFGLNAQQCNALLGTPPAGRALLEKPEPPIQRAAPRPEVATARNSVMLVVPTTHSYQATLEFERDNAGVYTVFRRHSSEGEKKILRETLILRRAHIDAAPGPRDDAPKLDSTYLEGLYVGIVPDRRNGKIEIWDMVGMVTHFTVTFHLWRVSGESRYLHQTLTVQRAQQGNLETSVGMFTGLTDGSDWLCAVPMLMNKTDIHHSVSKDAILQNASNFARVEAEISPLYKLIKPLLYKSEGEPSLARVGPGLLAIDHRGMRERFIEILERLKRDFKG